MKPLSILLFVLFSTLSINAQSSIEGIWNTGKENTKIKIKKNNNEIEGVILSSDNAKAPIGKLMIKEVIEKNAVFRGKLDVIKKGKWVDAVFNRKGDTLNITVSSGWMSKTIQWDLAD